MESAAHILYSIIVVVSRHCTIRHDEIIFGIRKSFLFLFLFN
jgi:hypothetical protein